MILAIVWILWLLLNVAVFLLYGIDKLKAKKNKWRIPERTLLTGTWLMGGVGAFLGMRTFRHKTQHLSFKVSAVGGMIISVAVMLVVTYLLLPA
ncbi:MAG: DUF1294 domain-containing protein [Clostridia bacterium]|nr:DUF1294 domain-containing protein [Clostridia bacterium]